MGDPFEGCCMITQNHCCGACTWSFAARRHLQRKHGSTLTQSRKSCMLSASASCSPACVGLVSVDKTRGAGMLSPNQCTRVCNHA